jgi:hypothetical protein
MCGVLYNAGSTPAFVFTEEYSVRGPAIHFAKIWHKCWLSDVTGRCTVQVAGHQRYNTTDLQKN